MSPGWTDLFTALALVLVIEGALYALFPATMRRVISEALRWPDSSLRTGGLVAAALGVAVVWYLRAP